MIEQRPVPHHQLLLSEAVPGQIYVEDVPVEDIQFNSILCFNSHRAIQFFTVFSCYLCH